MSRLSIPAILFTAMCLLPGFAAAADLMIECVRIGDLPPPAAADATKAPTTGCVNAPKTPAVAIGELVTVYLNEPPDCASTRTLLLDGISTGNLNDACDVQQRSLTFTLSHQSFADPASQEGRAATALWQRVLRNFWEADHMQRQAQLSVRTATENGSAVASNEVPIAFKVIHLSLLRLAALALVLVTMVQGARWAGPGLLRDREETPGKQANTFSLSRFQMTWWFSLVFLAYVFLWIVFGELPALNKSAFLLLGITGGTGLLATSIDKTVKPPAQESEGFFKDLTTDNNGLALHRFQLLVWTLFFGLVFVGMVASTLSFPDFDPTVFVLMGLSSVTYLGFKASEKHGDAAAADNAAKNGNGAKNGYGVS